MGWIKLDRSITEHWLWKPREPFDKRSAWIDLLLMANHEDFKTERNGHIVWRKRGEVNTSVLYLSERWGWSRNKVYRFLELLKEDGMIHTNGTTDGTTVTIENYGKWQGGQTTNGTTDGTPHETTDGTTDGTYDKNIKNIKKGKEDIYRELPQNLKDALKDFETMRKKIGKPMATDRAKKMLLTKLTKLAGDDTELKIRILEQSIFNSWQGVFPIKDGAYEDTRTRRKSESVADKDFGDFSDFGEITF